MARITQTTMDAVVVGVSAPEALVSEVDRLGAKRVLILASGTLNRDTAEVDRLRQALGSKCVGVFDSVSAHVPRKDVVLATEAARDLNVDLIVTIGGGTPTDAAKAVALSLANDITSAEQIDRLSVEQHLKAPTIPQISIPTTLSAGEYSAIAGVTNETSNTKEILRHPDLMPRVVILDPEVAHHTPEWLFLSTGLRAVDHCVEGIYSATSNPFGDAQALRGWSY